jgi:hypothetical protein
MTTYLEITNLASRGENLSLAGSLRGSASVNILPFQTAEVPVHDVQFDGLWLETLATYVERSKASVVLDGYVLTPDEIREMKHTDINEVLGQFMESKERTVVSASLGHGRYYSGLDGHPHYRAGNGADYDLTMGGTYLEQVTHRIYVDGGRTDVYVETGAITRPFKTIMAAVAASAPGDCISIACATYSENVVIAGDRHIDADPGAMLVAPVGCPLTVTDSLVVPSAFPLMFMRGLSVVNQDPTDWTIIVRSSGTWTPFVILIDNFIGTSMGGNVFWCDGGGIYATDAGGVIGDPSICVRVGAPGTANGGNFQAGKFNLGCSASGILFDIYENGFVDADGTNLLSNTEGGDPTSSICARMDGGPGGGGGPTARLTIRNARLDSGWGNLVRAVGPCDVRIFSDDVTIWDRFDGTVITMEDGNLDVFNSRFSARSDVVFALGAPGKSVGFRMKDVEARTNGAAARVFEASGFVSGTLDACRMLNTNPAAANGVLFFNSNGTLAITDGLYSGPGPVIDQRQGDLWLLGGADLVPTAAGIPGSTPLAVAVGAVVHRGHCNFRSGTPIIAGTEDILNSSFGTLSFGPATYMVRQGAGPTLPAGSQGYGRGSLFIRVPMPAGTPVAYINTGTEAAPVWVQLSLAYTPSVPANWAGAAPTDLVTALDRVANSLATHLGVPIP